MLRRHLPHTKVAGPFSASLGLLSVTMFLPKVGLCGLTDQNIGRLAPLEVWTGDIAPSPRTL